MLTKARRGMAWSPVLSWRKQRGPEILGAGAGALLLPKQEKRAVRKDIFLMASEEERRFEVKQVF